MALLCEMKEGLRVRRDCVGVVRVRLFIIYLVMNACRQKGFFVGLCTCCFQLDFLLLLSTKVFGDW